MRKPLFSRCWIGAVIFLATGTAAAHHGPPNNALYDLENIVEIEGRVTELFWRNPHVRFRIQLDSAESEIWEIESQPVTWLSRLGWTSEILSVGDRVRVAGYAHRHRLNEMALTNMLLPNGLEFTGRSQAQELRFSDRQVEAVRQEIAESDREAAISSADGIFRVWAWGVREFGGGGQPNNDVAFLTNVASVARDVFDLFADEPVLNCIQDGMPRAMFHPSIIEFTNEGSQIIFRSHEHDIRRTIHMSAIADPTKVSPSSLGFSVGEWDGDTLVVTTTRLNWHLSDELGTPQSSNVRLLERFTPTSDGERLDYELTSIDSAYLNGPSVRTAHWVWVPGLEIEPFQCELWERPAE
ncbi:MAG: DUF6152 family protein [Candidatus Rariloculaceae bacterium]